MNPMTPPDKIILHHSGTHDGSGEDMVAIHKWHVEHNHWEDIAYHYVIEQVEGLYRIELGRSLRFEGAHCRGHNHGSIGICVVGNFNLAPPPPESLDLLHKLLIDLYYQYGLLEGKETVLGHKELSRTDCPGKMFPLEEVRRRWMDAVEKP